MRIAVLPFNAAEGTKPAYGRQFAAFAAEQVRANTEAEINAVNLLTQIPDEQGNTRVAFVNVSEEVLPYDQIKDLFEQADVDLVQDGFLKESGEDAFELTLRYHAKGSETPVFQDVRAFSKAGLFQILHGLLKTLAEKAEVALPEGLSGEQMEFGTDDPDVFLKFLEGYDALSYVQQANGAVAVEFDPKPPIDALMEAVMADREFEGAYQVLVQLCRACAAFRIGNFELLQTTLEKLTAEFPEDFPAYFALSELFGSAGDHGRAAELLEKSVQLQPNDPALLTRLGVEQLQLNMPVNAERNFRKAIELGGPDRSAYDQLAGVLHATGRGHEVPPLWKALVDSNAQDAEAHAKYAISLIQSGRESDGERAFENGLEHLDDNSLIKRYYAPYLVSKGDIDRALDFYDDCLNVAPADVPLMVEYAQALETGGREVDLPEALKSILAANPDPNIRSTTIARLIELEQPKRVESVEQAREKMENGDFAGAVQILKPLRNWLADYWKLWALLSAAYNRLEQYTDAEESATRLLNLFPACEPAYGELVQALGGQGRHDEAYQLMRFATQNNPGSLPLHLNLGLAAKRAGHQDEARQLARAIREALGPNEEIEPVLAEIER